MPPSVGKVKKFYHFVSFTLIFRGLKIKIFVRDKVSKFYELSETILLFCLHYLHLDLFQFCIGAHPMLCYTMKQAIEL